MGDTGQRTPNATGIENYGGHGPLLLSGNKKRPSRKHKDGKARMVSVRVAFINLTGLT
jgi:hypothetical protein